MQLWRATLWWSSRLATKPIAPRFMRRRTATTSLLSVRAMRVEHLGRELPAVTVSIGVAAFEGAGDTAEMLLRRADGALYRAKRAGRDRYEAEARVVANG